MRFYPSACRFDGQRAVGKPHNKKWRWRHIDRLSRFHFLALKERWRSLNQNRSLAPISETLSFPEPQTAV